MRSPPESLSTVLTTAGLRLATLARGLTRGRERPSASAPPGAPAHASLLTKVLEQSPEGICLTDAQGLLVWANGAWERLTGWTLAEVAGRTPGSFLQGADSSEEARRAIGEAVREGRRFEGELQNYRRDGTPFWSSVRISPLFGEDGGLEGFVGMKHDITERRDRERALRAERTFLASLISSQADGVLATDRFGRVTEWNATLERWSGLARHEALGQDLGELALTPDTVTDRTRLSSLLLSGEPMAYERPHAFVRTGRHLRLETTVAAMRDVETGEITGALATLRDVSERYEQAEALRASRERLVDAIEALDSGFAMFDADDRLIAFNERFASMRDAATPPPCAGARREETLARGHDVGEAEERVVGDAIARIDVRRTREGGAVVLATDVTAFKDIQRSLEEARDAAQSANRAKSEFLARMSHELRTPLNSIIGFSQQVLKREEILPARERLFLERVVHNGRHLLGLINDILDLAKIESGRTTVQLAPTDLGALVREIVAMLEGQPRAEGVALCCDVPETIGGVVTDAVQLRQVLINLVGNALKFTRRGEVRVVVESRGDGVPTAIVARDTGMGIAADRLEAIFEAFEQERAETARDFGGTGLGLAISRRICQALGATLTVESVVGVGSSFRVQLR